ncbi:hypothetical protein AALO_G00149350 [Alosa alosa]|uniref:Uncharacterized protein n=1 Tax=Alosa alosa TaxID=278164 RepID=A0AAV6GE89_9TELE|nr:hypothetical protein AALO_G00149350 [Alosa alosa]
MAAPHSPLTAIWTPVKMSKERGGHPFADMKLICCNSTDRIVMVHGLKPVAVGERAVSPCDAYVVAGPLTLKRLRLSRWLVTFFWGWNMMMWTFGANMQPRTTKPLRLTEMHMVVVWTCM